MIARRLNRHSLFVKIFFFFFLLGQVPFGFAKETLSLSATQLASVPTLNVQGHGPSSTFELKQNDNNVEGKKVSQIPLIISENYKSVDGDKKAPPLTHWYRVDGAKKDEIAGQVNALSYTPVDADVGKKIEVTMQAVSTGNDASYTPNPDKGPLVTVTTDAVVSASDTAHVTMVSVSTDNQKANGVDKDVLAVMVRDGLGNVAPHAIVTATGPTETKITSPVSTDDQGRAYIPLTTTKAGTYRITAKAKADTSGLRADATFVADKSTIKFNAFTATQNNQVANNTAQDTATALITDENGNGLAAEPVTFALNSATAKMVGSATVNTDKDGKALLAITDTKAEVVKITANIKDGDGKNISKDVEVAFVGDQSTAQIINPTVVKEGAVANKKDLDTISAQVVDANGNPLAKFPIYFGGDRCFTTDGKAMDSNTLIDGQTDDAGNAVFSITATVIKKNPTDNFPWAGMNLEKKPITQSTNSKEFYRFLSFKADTTTAKIDSFTVTRDKQAANGVDADQLTALVTDANNNPVFGIDVLAKAASGNAKVSSPVKTDDTKGEAIITLSSTKADTYLISANLAGQGAVNTNAVLIGDKNTAQFDSLTVDKTGQVAGVTNDEFTLTVLDANKNPVTDFEVALAVTSPSAKAVVVNGTTAKTDAKGQVKISVSDVKAETVELVVTAKNGKGDALSSKVNASFIPNAATAAPILNVPLSVKTAVPIPVGVTVADANGNPVPNMDVTFSAQDKITVSKADGKSDANGVINGVTIQGNSGGGRYYNSITATVTSTKNTITKEVDFDAPPLIANLTFTLSGQDQSLVTNAVTLDGNDIRGAFVVPPGLNATGPWRPVWTSSYGGTPVTLPFKLTADGSTHNIAFNMYRGPDRPMDDAAAFELNYMTIMLLAENNKTLAKGTYTTSFTFPFIRWESSWLATNFSQLIQLTGATVNFTVIVP